MSGKSRSKRKKRGGRPSGKPEKKYIANSGGSGGRSSLGLPVFLFLVCVGAYFGNGDPMPGGAASDARSNMIVGLNLLKNHTFLIDPPQAPYHGFSWVLEQSPGRRVPVRIADWDDAREEAYRQGRLTAKERYFLVPTEHPGRYASAFGIGAALTVLPVYAALNLVTDLASSPALWWYGAKVTASLLTAGAALFIFLAMRRFVSPPWAALGALAFGLGTCAWTHSSQVLWQQTPFLFFQSLGAWGLFAAKERRDRALYCGAAFGAAVLCRPTGVIFFALAGLYLLLTAPRHLLRYALGGVPFILLFGWYNHYVFGSPLITGQHVRGDAIIQTMGLTSVWATPLMEGLAGIFLSPSRGLFVYSPVMALGFAGAVMMWREPRKYAPLIPLQLVVLVLCVLSAKHFDWWGGWSYGPRRMVGAGVFLTLLMIPVIVRVGHERWMRGLFAVLLLYSVAVQAIGAWSYNESGWNFKGGMHIDRPEHQSRLWSLSDSQIVHYLAHFRAERKKKQDYLRHELGNPPPLVISYKSGEPSP